MFFRVLQKSTNKEEKWVKCKRLPKASTLSFVTDLKLRMAKKLLYNKRTFLKELRHSLSVLKNLAKLSFAIIVNLFHP